MEFPDYTIIVGWMYDECELYAPIIRYGLAILGPSYLFKNII